MKYVKGANFCRPCRRLCVGGKHTWCDECNRPICPKCSAGDVTVETEAYLFCGDACAEKHERREAAAAAQRALEARTKTTLSLHHSAVTGSAADFTTRAIKRLEKSFTALECAIGMLAGPRKRANIIESGST